MSAIVAAHRWFTLPMLLAQSFRPASRLTPSAGPAMSGDDRPGETTMVEHTEHHRTVYWPAEADAEDALSRWGLTTQDLYNAWHPGTTIDEIADDLASFPRPLPTTNILRDAGIFASIINT